MRRLFVSVLVVTLLAAPLGETAKYWIPFETKLIVVGTVHAGMGYPSFDGWYETGTISVDEVLYGQPPPPQIGFRFLPASCPSPPWWQTLSWWQRWMPSHFIEMLTVIAAR